MPSNIILECSERDSTSTTDNSTWVTTFSEAVPIVSGDTIQMKTALINTRSATSGSIIISTDLTLTMTVAYYENRRVRVADSPYAGVTGQITNESVYKTSIKNIYPKPPGVGFSISLQAEPVVTYANHGLKVGAVLNFTGLTGGDADVINGKALEIINDGNLTEDTFSLKVAAGGNAFIDLDSKVVTFTGAVVNVTTPDSDIKGFYMLRGDNDDLFTQNVTFILEAGAYQPDDLASVITNKMYTTLDTSLGGSGPGLMISPVSETINAYIGGARRLVGIDASQGSFNYQPVSLTSFPNTESGTFNYMNSVVYPFIGASNTTLDFVNGRFQFNNLHSPYFQPQVSAAQDIYSIESLNIARTEDEVTVTTGIVGAVGGTAGNQFVVIEYPNADDADFKKFKIGMAVTGIDNAGTAFTSPAVFVSSIQTGETVFVKLEPNPASSVVIGASFSSQSTNDNLALPVYLSDAGSMVGNPATTGVLITGLKSAGDNNAFWSNLGFLSSIYYDDAVMKGLTTRSERVQYIESKGTGQVLQNPNLNSTFSSMLSSYPIFGGDIRTAKAKTYIPQEFYDQQATTKGLEADDTYVLDTTGYYLLEVIANFDTEYKRNDGRQSSIVGVISKQYNASDYVTGYLDSSIPYTHQGSPQSLSNFTVRVIDPSTKEPVKGLGGNSTVFMEIVKAPPAAVQKER